LDLLTQAILPFMVILLVLIVLHEAGHYFTAKWFGVKVLEAGIGLPPRIWGIRWRDTDYTINAIPFGAFVRMLGEEDPSDPQSLAAQVKWKRIVIIASGAGMNLLVAILLFSASLMIPQEVSVGGTVVAAVAPDSPAEAAGLREGDQILAVNGRNADSTTDAVYYIRLAQGSDVRLTIKRDDPRIGSETFDTTVHARWNPGTHLDECGVEQRQGPTGINVGPRHGQLVPLGPDERDEIEDAFRDAFQEYREEVAADAPEECSDGSQFHFYPLDAEACGELEPEERARAQERRDELFPASAAPCYEFDPPPAFEPFTTTRWEPPWSALPSGARLSFESLILIRNAVLSLTPYVDGGMGSGIAGPVGIAQATGEVVEQAGWVPLITLAGALSMSLAIINILPIPMVDGGRLVFIFIEFIRRGKRIDPNKEALVHLAGFVMLILAAIVITWYDIARWIGGDSLLQ
jgi:regulator of sigma E protease